MLKLYSFIESEAMQIYSYVYIYIISEWYYYVHKNAVLFFFKGDLDTKFYTESLGIYAKVKAIYQSKIQGRAIFKQNKWKGNTVFTQQKVKHII